nr:hypothetical protein [Tanacetum cinerariifolium]
MVTIDGVGFDWSYMAEDEVPTNMALMAFLDSETEFESYGPKTSKSVSEDISNEVKEYPDAPLVKDRVSDNKDCSVKSLIVVEKKTVVPTVAKIEFVRTKQQEKPVRKPVKPRPVNTARPRPVNTARPRPVNTARLRPVNTARPRPVNNARPNSTVVNVVRVNQSHLQEEDQGYVDSGCSRHMTRNISYL